MHNIYFLGDINTNFNRTVGARDKHKRHTVRNIGLGVLGTAGLLGGGLLLHKNLSGGKKIISNASNVGKDISKDVSNTVETHWKPEQRELDFGEPLNVGKGWTESFQKLYDIKRDHLEKSIPVLKDILKRQKAIDKVKALKEITSNLNPRTGRRVIKASSNRQPRFNTAAKKSILSSNARYQGRMNGISRRPGKVSRKKI